MQTETQEKACLFCLENVKPDEEYPNPIGCACQITTHGSCLQAWFDSKQQMECAICHTICIPHQSYEISTHEIIHLIHVDRTPIQLNMTRQRRNERVAGVCCYLLLGWWVGGILFQMIFDTSK